MNENIPSIDDKDKLLKYIEMNLKPKTKEKKEFVEVFTPMNLVNEMLDKLDSSYQEDYKDSIFSNKNLKWFDPANGLGNFPIAIYYRLLNGLKDQITDEKERKKHILENMIYMSELNLKNCFICKQIFDIRNEYKLNLFNGDSLKLNIEEEWGIKEFDVIIGNPPYNEILTSTGAKPLYNQFIDTFINKTKLLNFIIPSRWFSGGKGLDKFRDSMLKRKDIKYINHFDDASKLFGNHVDIKGGVNYFLKDKNYEGKCNYNGDQINLNQYDILIENKYYSIIDKLKNYNSITKYYISQDHYKIQTNDSRLLNINNFKEEFKNNYLKCYVSQQKGFVKYIEKSSVKNINNNYKIITTRASYEHKSGFGNTFIGYPDEVHTKSYISFNLSEENEAKSLLSYLKCKLPNFLLSLRKSSQDISESTCKWIPLVPLDKDWNDDEVYKYFNLSNEDIKLIEETKIKYFSL